MLIVLEDIIVRAALHRARRVVGGEAHLLYRATRADDFLGLCDDALELFGRVSAAKGWGDAEEFARAVKLTGVVERMKARMAAAAQQQGGA